MTPLVQHLHTSTIARIQNLGTHANNPCTQTVLVPYICHTNTGKVKTNRTLWAYWLGRLAYPASSKAYGRRYSKTKHNENQDLQPLRNNARDGHLASTSKCMYTYTNTHTCIQKPEIPGIISREGLKTMQDLVILTSMSLLYVISRDNHEMYANTLLTMNILLVYEGYTPYVINKTI